MTSKLLCLCDFTRKIRKSVVLTGSAQDIDAAGNNVCNISESVPNFDQCLINKMPLICFVCSKRFSFGEIVFISP